MPKDKQYHFIYDPNDEEMKRVCDRLRKEFEAYGFDVSDMSDEDMCNVMTKFAEAARKAGISALKASEAFADLGRRLREMDNEEVCQGSPGS
jgi:hypothetical protein